MPTPKVFGLVLGLALAAWPQQQPQLKARELFYTPIAETKPTGVKEAPPKTATAKAQKPKPTRTPTATPEAPPRADDVKLQNASHTEETVGPPLALKYRLLKRTEDGRYDEVDSATVFRSGDKIRVSVESNDSAYLYIVQQGSSNAWNVLFPNKDTADGSNRIGRNQEYDLPGGGRFTFDDQPGTERLFLVLSRRPEQDLEKLIYSLNEGATTPAAAPGNSEPRMMMAQNRIDDAIINRLRTQFQSRDLVFEKVNEEKVTEDSPQRSEGSRREKALYVATPDRTANARVVVDLTLKHQ